MIKWNYPLNISQPPSAQYLLLTTMLWVNGVGLAPELRSSSGTAWRKSYGRRISRDKLNNCTLVREATTTKHINIEQI